MEEGREGGRKAGREAGRKRKENESKREKNNPMSNKNGQRFFSAFSEYKIQCVTRIYKVQKRHSEHANSIQA